MTGRRFDVVVIGAGPGGYVCAIRCAQLGLETACVERRGSLGGTCLNIGCIPSKALLQSSELYEQARNRLDGHGVKLAGVELDLGAMMARKDKVVSGLTRGIDGLFRKNKVTRLAGTGRIVDGGTVDVDGETISAGSIVIATGSHAADLPGIEIDEKRVVSSTGALALGEVPARMLVIGAGFIGLELGSVWRRLGAGVTVVEFLDRIAPGLDGELARSFRKLLERQGMAFRLATRVTGIETRDDGLRATLEPAAGGDGEHLDCDVALVAVGRRPATDGLGVVEAGIGTDDLGRIEVDGRFATSVPGVFAIGDCIAGPMLAHKAEDEGIAVAEIIVGKAGHVNRDAIPGVVYTDPEAAYVGRTEEELREAGVDYAAGRFSMLANSRARTSGHGGGMVKILAERGTDRILGVHILGPCAGELIAEAVLAMEFGASAEDLARTCHAHPTYAEAVREAALAVDGRAIHA